MENNLLSRQKDEIVSNISEKLEKNGVLIPKDYEQAKEYLVEDVLVNHLIQQYQKSPDSLSAGQKNYLFSKALEIASSHGLSMTEILNWDFTRASISRNDDKLKRYVATQFTREGSVDYRLTQSLYTAEQALLLRNGLGLASTSTKAILPTSAAISTGIQYLQNGEIDPKKVALDMGASYIGQYVGWKGATVIGATTGGINNYWDGKDIAEGAVIGGATGLFGYRTGGVVEKVADIRINHSLRPDWIPHSSRMPYVLQDNPKSEIPKVLGEAAGGAASTSLQIYLEKKLEEKKNEK